MTKVEILYDRIGEPFGRSCHADFKTRHGQHLFSRSLGLERDAHAQYNEKTPYYAIILANRDPKEDSLLIEGTFSATMLFIKGGVFEEIEQDFDVQNIEEEFISRYSAYGDRSGERLCSQATVFSVSDHHIPKGLKEKEMLCQKDLKDIRWTRRLVHLK